MRSPRSHEQHVALYVAYADRVSKLPATAWDRLRARCADLNGPAFHCLLNRTALAVKPYELWLPAAVSRRPMLRAIRGISRAAQLSLNFAYEFMAEFEADGWGAEGEPWKRSITTGNPTADAYVDANFLIASTVIPLERTNPGVVTAVRTGGQALMRHDWLSDENFEAAYHYMESEIPFADLEGRPPDRIQSGLTT